MAGLFRQLDNCSALVLAGRMVDYAPLSGLGLSVRAVDIAVCTINSPLLIITQQIYISLQKLRLH